MGTLLCSHLETLTPLQEMHVKLEDQAGEPPVNTKQGALHPQSELNWERAVDPGSDGQEHSMHPALLPGGRSRGSQWDPSPLPPTAQPGSPICFC